MPESKRNNFGISTALHSKSYARQFCLQFLFCWLLYDRIQIDISTLCDCILTIFTIITVLKISVAFIWEITCDLCIILNTVGMEWGRGRKVWGWVGMGTALQNVRGMGGGWGQCCGDGKGMGTGIAGGSGDVCSSLIYSVLYSSLFTMTVA